ncbi:O-antigen ligase family protein [Sodalis ligni]|uniref:O-antigen ligase-like membrane protein n=1 Tax=Sodalis ligni TaxID=2697027 RepID=A0A4R1NIE9_9GAMM|nr:O-antigen ligase family protein [Sodalis ligni]TCL07333.1 O-antigen ligase-like membrane protein [Sodalis ligni]
MISQKKFTDAIFIILMSLTIFALSIKGDGSSEFLTVHYPPVINFIKNNALFIAIATIFLTTTLIVSRQRFIKINVFDPLLWFFVYKLILGSRMVFTDTGLDLKQIVSFFMVVMIYFLICCRTSNYQVSVTNIIKIIFLTAVLLCLINYYNLFFNYGGSSWKGRFFGIYTHPNFLAVDHATIIAISLGYLSEKNKGYFNRFKFDQLICFFNLIASFLLIILSGSRTGIVGFSAALIVYGVLNFKRNIILSICLFFVSLVALVYFYLNLSDIAQDSTGLTRILNAGNTRAQVWGGLWHDFMSSPLIGIGSLSIGTSGSYLKILSLGGIMLFIPFLIMLIFLFRQCVYQIKIKNYIFLYPIACLLACALTEGILTEGASFPILILLLIIISLSFSRKRSASLVNAYTRLNYPNMI